MAQGSKGVFFPGNEVDNGSSGPRMMQVYAWHQKGDCAELA